MNDMESKELRIGNWLIKDDGLPERIAGIPNLLGIRFLGFDHVTTLSKCKPIPLTEEWLLRFGFELINKSNQHYCIQHPNGYGSQFKIHFHFTINNQWSLAFSDKASGKVETYICATHIEYVHQLQNLYHSLTGEELKLK